eukprot:33727-Eustigmatos_ZCMA.PRE.1
MNFVPKWCTEGGLKMEVTIKVRWSSLRVRLGHDAHCVVPFRTGKPLTRVCSTFAAYRRPGGH